MKTHTPSVAMLKTQVTTLTGAGAGLGADCADARAKRSRLKQRKWAEVARDFLAILPSSRSLKRKRETGLLRDGRRGLHFTDIFNGHSSTVGSLRG